jgi:hypothetical protein
MTKGLDTWNDRYRRLQAMTPRELADRLRQHMTARADWLRYKLDIDFAPRLDFNASSPYQPQFFFSIDSVSQLCSTLGDLFPQECERIIDRAQRICDQKFDLLGYRNLDYGPEIDWRLDRVHGKRAPQKPWFRMRYLDFPEVGDSKVTWELNRHQHLVMLAKAFRLTNQEKFVDALFHQWSSWHRQNPYSIGINWASSLEVALRSLSWLWIYYLMAGSPAMPSGFRIELLRSLAVSGRHIENHLSTYFSPNTHLLGEGTALFFVGTLCPELPRARRWQQLGWEILQQAADRQVRPDGLHFEQSIYYHVYALDFFLHSAVLASRNRIPIPPRFHQTLESMLHALCVLGRSGPPPSLGDDDGGRVFDGQRNQQAHLLDPLAIGAVMFGRGDFKRVAGGPREELLWLLGESGIAEFERLPPTPPASSSNFFEASGLYVMSDNSLGRQLVIDAGPQGADTAGHGHADALSITANLDGIPLLIDSGTFEYVGPNDFERDRFRGTKAHNTLLVDGQDQAQPKGPFRWVSLPKVQAERWIHGETFDFFMGSHDGYTRLADPVVHRRSVFSLKSAFWLVRDQAIGQAKHQLELFWHLAADFSPGKNSQTQFQGPGASLSILSPYAHGWSQDLRLEDFSPAYGQKKPHAVLHFSTVAALPAEFVTLLAPSLGSVTSADDFASAASPSVAESAVCYRFTTAQHGHCIVFGEGKPWTSVPWTSDAELLYYRQSRDNAQQTLICCNGSYVEVGGRKVISSPQKWSSCEVVGSEGKIRVFFCGEEVVVDEDEFSGIALAEDHK